MKILHAISFSLLLTPALLHAQTEIPKGYQQGTLVLGDNTQLSGYIKDNMKRDAAVYFIAQGTADKKQYSGSELKSVTINGVQFACISGDFFKVICNGTLCFLQKQSDASGKVTYNGANAEFASGTEGKPGDYFIYRPGDHSLQLVSKKNMADVTATAFAGHTAALEQAKKAAGNPEALSEAVTIYNKAEK